MTNFSREPSLDDAPSAPPITAQRFSSGALLAWAVIVASVMVLLPRPRAVPDAPAAGEPRVESRAASVQFRLLARQVVGSRALLDQHDIPIAALLDAARNQGDQVRAAMVLGEIRSAEVAIEQLDSLPVKDYSEPLQRDVQTLRTIYTEGRDAISPEDRAALQRRHRWFADLALSFGLPEEDPQRQAAIQPAVRTVITLGIAGIGIILALLLGLALLIVATVLAAYGKLARQFQPQPQRAYLYLEAFALAIAVLAAVRLLDLSPLRGTPWLWGIVAALAPLLCFWPVLRGIRFSEVLHGLGWHRGSGIFREIGIGILSYFAALPLIAIGLIISVLLMRLTGADATHPIVDRLTADPLRLLMILLLASVYAPLAEETMFRGAFYHGVRPQLGLILGSLVVAFVFAVIHPQGWAGVPALMSIALALGIVREWRGSLIGPVVMHAINNAVIVLLFVMMVG